MGNPPADDQDGTSRVTGDCYARFGESPGVRFPRATRPRCTATATRGGQVQRLEARHRVHARVEGFIRCGKDTGLAQLALARRSRSTPPGSPRSPSPSTCCAGCGCCYLDGPLAKAEPATLRYRLLHAAARLVKRSRYLILRVPETWPWAQEFAAAVNRVRAIP